ncbi:MAG: DUF294 nucleotidyltransferase-like domain-containing protein [Candidatus Bathyarchaeota archaeon]|nr:DUF294 nucleotidyltransferase-like domain-containing protein [Candidatus Bathyarchaeota archaeon]
MPKFVMEKEEIRKFLTNHLPFSLLKEEELELLIQNAIIRKFNRGEVVFHAGEAPVKYLYVLYDGVVFLLTDSNIVEHIKPGEAFGVVSAISGAPARMDAVAEEDSTCILIPCEDFKKVFNLNKNFSAYYISLLERRLTALYKLYEKELIRVPERYPVINRVGDIITRDVVVCSFNTTIQDAVNIMYREKVGSIVVVDEEKRPVGIITARDLRKIIAEKIDISQPISKVMSSPVVYIDEDRALYEAYLLQISKSLNHLVVVDAANKVKGVVTSKDLMVAIEPTYSLSILSKRIVKADKLEELRKIHKQALNAINSLLNRGVGFVEMAELFTVINDMFTRRVLEIMEKRLMSKGSWKPVRYVWVVAGSSGRREQILRTDQDNAIIYDENVDEKGEKLLEELANLTNKGLVELGIPECKANYMASNPQWRKSLGEWKKYFDSWISFPDGDNLIRLALFLDLRPVYGDESLTQALKTYVLDRINMNCARSLAKVSVSIVSPISFFGGIKYDEKGLDIKLFGLFPIVTGVKSLIVEAKSPVTNTLERIDFLVNKGVLTKKERDELKEAYMFLSTLRLKHQLTQTLKGEEPDNYIKPNELTKFEENILKECFRVISNHQKFLISRFGLITR